MRNRIVILAISVCMTVIMNIGCQSSEKKVEKDKEKVQELNKDVEEVKSDINKVKQDFTAEYKQFKKESEDKINAFEESIAEFKIKIAHSKKEDKIRYEKELTVLEQKNSAMKKKLEAYNDEGQDKWELFKEEFGRDMDELKKAFKDISVDTVN